jgi:hypothetical protein
MKNTELMSSLSEEVKQKVDGGKTEAGIEQLNDELLEDVTGGELRDTHMHYRYYSAPEESSESVSKIDILIK